MIEGTQETGKWRYLCPTLILYDHSKKERRNLVPWCERPPIVSLLLHTNLAHAKCLWQIPVLFSPSRRSKIMILFPFLFFFIFVKILYPFLPSWYLVFILDSFYIPEAPQNHNVTPSFITNFSLKWSPNALFSIHTMLGNWHL